MISAALPGIFDGPRASRQDGSPAEPCDMTGARTTTWTALAALLRHPSVYVGCRRML